MRSVTNYTITTTKDNSASCKPSRKRLGRTNDLLHWETFWLSKADPDYYTEPIHRGSPLRSAAEVDRGANRRVVTGRVLTMPEEPAFHGRRL